VRDKRHPKQHTVNIHGETFAKSPDRLIYLIKQIAQNKKNTCTTEAEKTYIVRNVICLVKL